MLIKFYQGGNLECVCLVLPYLYLVLILYVIKPFKTDFN